MAGISRSVAITAMYIMLVTSLDNEQALAIIKHCRPQAGPNLGFRMQLQTYYRNHVEKVCVRPCVCVYVTICVCVVWVVVWYNVSIYTRRSYAERVWTDYYCIVVF